MDNRVYGGLVRAGLTNIGSEDLGVLAMARTRETYAYCTSRACCVSILGQKVRVRKHVEASAKLCSDCGHALMWKQEKETVAA